MIMQIRNEVTYMKKKMDAFTLWMNGRTEEAVAVATEENDKICSMGANKYYKEESKKHPKRKKNPNMIVPPKN